jgi:hypothetical protein
LFHFSFFQKYETKVTGHMDQQMSN